VTQSIAVRRDPFARAGSEKRVEAPARWSSPWGLFIHPRYRQDETFAERGAYVIAHAESGKALHAGSFKRLRDAREVAEALLTIGDWRRTGRELSADRELAEGTRRIIAGAWAGEMMNR
jgi:hypothetical protein